TLQQRVDLLDVEFLEVAVVPRMHGDPGAVVRPLRPGGARSRAVHADVEFFQAGVVEVAENVLDLNRLRNRADEVHEQAKANDAQGQGYEYAEAGDPLIIALLDGGDQQQGVEDGTEVETQGFLMPLAADQAGNHPW